jgi:hypothetical protein
MEETAADEVAPNGFTLATLPDIERADLVCHIVGECTYGYNPFERD